MSIPIGPVEVLVFLLVLIPTSIAIAGFVYVRALRRSDSNRHDGDWGERL